MFCVTDGLPWESMEIKVSRRETGSWTVRRVRVTFNTRHTVTSLPQIIIPFPFIEFKYGKACILIATDVASRGLGQYFSRWPCLRVVSLPFFFFRQNPRTKKKNIVSLLKKVIFAFFNFFSMHSEFFSPKGAVFVAGPRHDKPQGRQRGKEKWKWATGGHPVA